VIAHSSCLIYVPGAVFTLGVSGVDIFFVISGFIICQVAARPHTGALTFLVRRWWRIFPLYWIVLTFAVVVDAYGVTWAPWMSARHSALDYIFLMTTENHFLPQAWSLVFELYFYTSIAFVLLVSPPGRFYRTLAVWIVAQVALIVLCGPNGGPPVNAQSLEFVLGCAIAWLNARNLIRREFLAGVLGLLLIVVGDWWSAHVASLGLSPVSRLVTFGAGAALCLYALVGWERRGIVSFPSGLVRVGDASYSLYLWHIPLFAVAMALSIRGPKGVEIFIPLILLAAFASYHWIEAPLLRLDASTVVGGFASVVGRAAGLRWELRRIGGALAFLSRRFGAEPHSTKILSGGKGAGLILPRQ
jgi:peptidoglycan/LPS O-acetylase OafA/YrhL